MIIGRYFGYDKTLKIPAKLGEFTVVGIGYGAFYGYYPLPSDSLESISKDAFRGCKVLTSISLPNSLKSIGDLAFAGCSSLKSISLPDKLQSIGDRAFSGCSSLTSIKVSSDNRTFYSKDGVLFHKKDKVLLVYPAGKTATEYSIPQGISQSQMMHSPNTPRLHPSACPTVFRLSVIGYLMFAIHSHP